MKKSILIINIILSALVLIGDICYTILGGTWLKGITSFGFVLIGITNLIYAIKLKSNNLRFPIIMLIGLFFAMLGDIILNIHFMSGAILFAIGHIFFFIAYCQLLKFNWKDLIPGFIIFIPSTLFIVLTPIFDFCGLIMEFICIIYALIISLMLGKSISNLLAKKSLTNIVIFVGSFLFFFSDLMLLFNVFANAHIITDILCLMTYYPAEILLAYSLFQKQEDELNLNAKNLSI